MYVGTMLIVIALFHLVAGGVLYAAVLSAIAAEGVFDSVTDFGDRAAALWFLITGLLVLVLGACVRDSERAGLPLPVPLAPGLLLLTVAIVVPMPASGAWAFALPAWFAYRRSRVRG